VSPERDDYRDDDEREEFASRSIFSAGWFRAVLVLTVLAIVVVISLPYLLNWFEPSTPARVAKPAEPLKPAPGAPSAPAPAAPIGAAPEVKPAPPVTPAPAPAPKATIAPPAAPAQAPKAVVEKAIPPASSEPPRKAVPEKAPAKPEAEKAVTKAPAKTATERPPTKGAETVPPKTADKPAAPARVAAKADAPSRPAAVAPSGEAASGNYWIQLGAFKEQKNADALAKTLRDAGFPIQVTPIRPGGGGESKVVAQQHELFVTETSVDKVNAALKGRGTAQPVSGGVTVKPAFSLQDAMTVSKRLTDEGLKVVIRPAGSLATPSLGPGVLHAVRAGGYSNRTSALAARDELAAKGHRGFLAEGPAK
jgi:outer membrane biosynthesis protein TonB